MFIKTRQRHCAFLIALRDIFSDLQATKTFKYWLEKIETDLYYSNQGFNHSFTWERYWENVKNHMGANTNLLWERNEYYM